jgi:general secretion pathway protein E
MPAQTLPTVTDVADPRSAAFMEAFSACLVKFSFLDELGLRRARRAQVQSGERFDLVLTRLGLLTEVQLVTALSDYLQIPVMLPAELSSGTLVVSDLPLTFLKTTRTIPIFDTGEAVVVATADPFNSEAARGLAHLLNRPIERRLATAGDVDHAIERLYGEGRSIAPRADDIAPVIGAQVADDDVRRLEDMASEAPIIRLAQDIIVRAVEQQASDIHFEPTQDSVRVRFRIDGVLHTIETLPMTVRLAISSRIKIMAGLNIAERRLPQDGRTKITVRGREIDLRVSTMPTMCGESVVLRILDRSSVALDFKSLGFGGEELAAFERLLAEPNGIILVTGPTGSGKTTTLYAALSTLNKAERKLFTVEDPIEYRLAGVNQIQVNPRIGLNFASALRSMLRQDPDIMMLGEIRDLETAEIAVRASLTGHVVLSTIHTNSAVATITRLLDMGVEDYLLASSLKGVLAQRLVRKLCSKCAEPAAVPAALAERLLKLSNSGREKLSGLKKACGCSACRHTGFSGRTTLYELLVMTDALRNVIVARGSEQELRATAQASGMVPMLSNGLGKAFAGETTLDEVLRVTSNVDAAL